MTANLKTQIFKAFLFSILILLIFLIVFLIIALIWRMDPCTGLPDWAVAECLSYPAPSLLPLFAYLGASIIAAAGDLYLMRKLQSNTK